MDFASVSAIGQGINGFLGQHPVLAVLIGSALFIQGTRKDITHGNKFGAAFWQFVALYYLVSFLVWTLYSHLWLGATTLAVALSVEVWLVKRWWLT